MIPTVGRIVHYTSLGDADGKYPAEQQAAIITGVKKHDGVETHQEDLYDIWLRVFYKTGDFFMEKVPYSPEYRRGHWTWPPKA